MFCISTCFMITCFAFVCLIVQACWCWIIFYKALTWTCSYTHNNQVWSEGSAVADRTPVLPFITPHTTLTSLLIIKLRLYKSKEKTQPLLHTFSFSISLFFSAHLSLSLVCFLSIPVSAILFCPQKLCFVPLNLFLPTPVYPPPLLFSWALVLRYSSGGYRCLPCCALDLCVRVRVVCLHVYLCPWLRQHGFITELSTVCFDSLRRPALSVIPPSWLSLIRAVFLSWLLQCISHKPGKGMDRIINITWR